MADRRSQWIDIEDFALLETYLRQTARINTQAHPSFRRLGGGVSNRVVLVEFSGGSGWVIKQALEKLRVAADWHCSPERIHREASALALLETLAPHGSITPLIFEDQEQFLLAMEAVPQPHKNWKRALLETSPDPRLFEEAGALLGSIHRHGATIDSAVRQEFSDRQFFYALRVEPYYLYTASVVPEAADFLRGLAAEMEGIATTIVHGDFSPKNMLIYRDHLVLLDHEVTHLGDPAFDLGFFLAHVLSKARHFPARRGYFLAGAARFCAAYELSHDLEASAMRHTLGCLLARVEGRSPLEYLAPEERREQRIAVTVLLNSPPATLGSLTDSLFSR